MILCWFTDKNHLKPWFWHSWVSKETHSNYLRFLFNFLIEEALVEQTFSFLVDYFSMTVDDVVHNVVGDLMRFVFKIRSTERMDVNKSSVPSPTFVGWWLQLSWGWHCSSCSNCPAKPATTTALDRSSSYSSDSNSWNYIPRFLPFCCCSSSEGTKFCSIFGRPTSTWSIVLHL